MMFKQDFTLFSVFGIFFPPNFVLFTFLCDLLGFLFLLCLVFSNLQSQASVATPAMPRYYCDYCDTYLTHDSPSVRKQHNAGYKHKANVRIYYQQFEEQQTQSLIDQRIKEHLGQAAAAYHQVGTAYNQHLLAQRPPRLPVLPTPIMPPIPGSGLLPGIRPPVLPRPLTAASGYIPPPMMPPTVAPPGAPSIPGQVNILPRPPTISAPATIPGSSTTPTSSKGAPPMTAPAMYQANPVAPTSANYDSFNVNNQAPETNQ